VRKKIGECLVQAGLITEQDLRVALAEHKRTGERIGAVLVRLNLATEKQIAKALALQLGFAYLNLVDNPPDPSAVTLIPKDIALKRACVAVGLEKNLLTVAMADPLLFSLVQDLEFKTGYRIKQVVSTRTEIIETIHRAYPDNALIRIDQGSNLASTAKRRGRSSAEALEGETSLARRREPQDDVFETAAGQAPPKDAGETPVIELVDLIIKSAIDNKASDIHVEPGEKGVIVRHRLDGLLKEVMDLPKWVHDGLIARLKIMAGMDIAEKRLPQDGRLRAHTPDGRDVDFRVSTLRTLFGEKVVMRVLDQRKGVPELEEIGLSATALQELRAFLRHQHGMILVVGPTGSGKTTTLGAAVSEVHSERTNIITIEDPVEYQIPGVNQTQINEKIKLTFATALRSILRQDPDVILVGEIRDAETAKIALQAAQTGHLVLSTLHTDDAPSCVTRLMDIGTEPYVIASALVGVVAQRLVRRLCVHCRRQYTPSAETLRALNIPESEASSIPFYKSVGCDECHHTGYRGRIGIYEVMTVTDKVRRLIASRAPEDQIREGATAGGMITLGEDGLAKVKSGITTPEELLRVVTEIREIRTLCTGCGAAVGVDFLACPSCGKRLSGGCPHCGRSLQPGWNFCPYCARSTEVRRAPKRLRDGAVRGRPRDEPRRELPIGNVAEFKK
jgi:type IV pilus assembly protein PilB